MISRALLQFRLPWMLWRAWIRLRYAVTSDCGLACGYAEPFGFVPEADGPIHDREE